MALTSARAAEAPLKNELLDKLDQTLRDRAKAMVDEVLDPAISEACGKIEDALYPLLGTAAGPEVRNRIGIEAATKIRERADELTYRKLVDQTLDLIAGKPVKAEG